MICRTVLKRTYFTMEESNVDISTLVPSVAEVARLVDLLKIRYANNWIVYTDTEVVPWTDEPEVVADINKVNEWKNRFKYIYETTSERYFKLISLYKSQEANLLNKIESASTTKFNDTPQNANVGDSDEYTSTVSKVSTSVDPGELIDRLNNIHNKLKDLYDEWVNEFEQLFGTSTLL